jgi:hypothetical protein
VSGGFVLPPYPYDRLDRVRGLADALPGGAVDLSVGTPCDDPSPLVLDARALAEVEARDAARPAPEGELADRVRRGVEAQGRAEVGEGEPVAAYEARLRELRDAATELARLEGEEAIDALRAEALAELPAALAGELPAEREEARQRKETERVAREQERLIREAEKAARAAEKEEEKAHREAERLAKEKAKQEEVRQKEEERRLIEQRKAEQMQKLEEAKKRQSLHVSQPQYSTISVKDFK